MRRKDKEILDIAVIEEILKKTAVCRVAMCDGDDPYIVPLNYAYQNMTIYAHSASSGRKIDVLKKNNKVCVEVDSDLKIITSDKACNFSMQFRSVIASGIASLCNDEQEKKKALGLIMQKYSGKSKWDFMSDRIQNLCVLKIKLHEITGKKSHIH